MLDPDDAPRRQPDQLFDDVLELADVARPLVIRKRSKRIVREAQLPPGARKEVLSSARERPRPSRGGEARGGG